jgi:Rrf2 family nitric oxide-sensitive transcriptional repressor
MQLTLFSDYSLRVLLYLSIHHDRRVPLPEISAAYGISQHHLVKVVQRLVEEELIESVRGRGGGLRLGRPPREINIAAVVRMTEPTLTLVECFDARTNTCPIDAACGLKTALARAQKAFFAELEQHTLAEFSSRGPAWIQLWRRHSKQPPA